MSGRYRKVDCAYWLGELAELLRGDEPDAGDTDAHAVACYLMTCPESNQIGAYRLALPTICDVLNISSRRASEALRKLSGFGFCLYDERFRMVFVTEFARHEYDEVPNLSDNRVKSLRAAMPGLLSVCRKSLIWKAFWDRYGEPWAHLLEGIEPPESKGSGRAPEGLPDASGTDAVSGTGTGTGDSPPSPPQGGERGRRVASLPEPYRDWYSRMPTEEKSLVAEYIEEGTDPDTLKSPKTTRAFEDQMRRERAALLARLYVASKATNGSGDTPAELWVEWREERRRRHGKAVKPPADDWRADVLALRGLRGRRDVREILEMHAAGGWRGLRIAAYEQERDKAAKKPLRRPSPSGADLRDEVDKIYPRGAE